MTGLITEYVGAGLAAARPVTPAVASGATAFYYATDTSVLSVWDGSAWDTVGGGGGTSLFPVKPPTTSLFSYQALGTGVTLGVNGGTNTYAVKRTDTGTAAERCGFRGKAVPAGSSWTAEIGFFTTPFGRSSKLRAGLMLYESGTGKFLLFNYDSENGSPQLFIFGSTSLDAITAVVTTGPVVYGGRFPFHQRVTYDGTNYTFEYSLDLGESWESFAVVAKATYFTTAADKIGMGLNTGTSQGTGECRADIYYYDDPDFP